MVYSKLAEGVKTNFAVCASVRFLLTTRTPRYILKVAFGTGLGLLLQHGAMAQDTDPHNARPQEGDRLVFTGGERQGTIITLEDLPVGGPPVTAYPMDPSTRVVRDGSRLNEVLLIR